MLVLVEHINLLGLQYIITFSKNPGLSLKCVNCAYYENDICPTECNNSRSHWKPASKILYK